MAEVFSVLFHRNVFKGGAHFELQVQSAHGADDPFVHDFPERGGGAALEAAEADHRIFIGLQFQDESIVIAGSGRGEFHVFIGFRDDALVDAVEGIGPGIHNFPVVHVNHAIPFRRFPAAPVHDAAPADANAFFALWEVFFPIHRLIPVVDFQTFHGAGTGGFQMEDRGLCRSPFVPHPDTVDGGGKVDAVCGGSVAVPGPDGVPDVFLREVLCKDAGVAAGHVKGAGCRFPVAAQGIGKAHPAGVVVAGRNESYFHAALHGIHGEPFEGAVVGMDFYDTAVFGIEEIQVPVPAAHVGNEHDVFSVVQFLVELGNGKGIEGGVAARGAPVAAGVEIIGIVQEVHIMVSALGRDAGPFIAKVHEEPVFFVEFFREMPDVCPGLICHFEVIALPAGEIDECLVPGKGVVVIEPAGTHGFPGLSVHVPPVQVLFSRLYGPGGVAEDLIALVFIFCIEGPEPFFLHHAVPDGIYAFGAFREIHILRNGPFPSQEPEMDMAAVEAGGISEFVEHPEMEVEGFPHFHGTRHNGLQFMVPGGVDPEFQPVRQLFIAIRAEGVQVASDFMFPFAEGLGPHAQAAAGGISHDDSDGISLFNISAGNIDENAVSKGPDEFMVRCFEPAVSCGGNGGITRCAGFVELGRIPVAHAFPGNHQGTAVVDAVLAGPELNGPGGKFSRRHIPVRGDADGSHKFFI